MGREMVQRHLSQAEGHVADAERHVARQRQLVAELERDNHDTTEARRLLATFTDLLAMHRADRDRL